LWSKKNNRGRIKKQVFLRREHTRKIYRAAARSSKIIAFVPELVAPAPIHLFSHNFKLLLCRLKY